MTTTPKRPEAMERGGMWADVGWCYDTDEADAYIDWQSALIRDLLSDHQRMYPHHADMCDLCKRAEAAIGKPVQTEICPVCRTVHDKPLCRESK